MGATTGSLVDTPTPFPYSVVIPTQKGTHPEHLSFAFPTIQKDQQ
jgi:hypothetical protein